MLIAIAVFCTLCEALFTALEVAFGTVSRARLRALVEAEHAVHAATPASGRSSTGDTARPAAAGGAEHAPATAASAALVRRAECVLRMGERPARLTLVFIIITSLMLWTATATLTWQALDAGWPLWTLPVALVGVLFVAEALPLLVAARNPEGVALRGARLAEASSSALAPLLTVLGGAGRGMAWLMGAGTHLMPQVTEGELRTALATAEEEGVIESDERAMLEGAMDFRGKLVREVMTPRIDIIGTPAAADLHAVLQAAMREGHSRLPVYQGTLDKIIGIVAAKDLIPYLRRAPRDGAAAARCARDVMRTPYFVPENKLIGPTLEALRRQRTLMAIVVDADGGTAGLVTLEDLLEEIVGDIQDEYDAEEPTMRVVGATGSNESGADGASSRHAVEAEAGVSVRDLERFWRKSFGETLRFEDDDGPVDSSLSLAALALDLFDGVPRTGDRIAAGTVARSLPAPVELEIAAMDGPRIEIVRIAETAASVRRAKPPVPHAGRWRTSPHANHVHHLLR